MMISELNAQYYVLHGYSFEGYWDGYWVVVKFIYLCRISKPNSPAADHIQPELDWEFKLNDCCVLFPEILAWNVALDNAECCGTSKGLGWSYKKFLSDRIE